MRTCTGSFSTTCLKSLSVRLRDSLLGYDLTNRPCGQNRHASEQPSVVVISSVGIVNRVVAGEEPDLGDCFIANSLTENGLIPVPASAAPYRAASRARRSRRACP